MTIIDADRTAIDSLVAPTPFPGSFAVSYLRVSTKEQAEKGGQAEGFSIPAQREANQRKADQLGATIIEEFVDAGAAGLGVQTVQAGQGLVGEAGRLSMLGVG